MYRRWMSPRLESVAGRLNDQFAKERGKLTLLPFIMRAVVLGVRQFPQINARYDDTADVGDALTARCIWALPRRPTASWCPWCGTRNA